QHDGCEALDAPARPARRTRLAGPTALVRRCTLLTGRPRRVVVRLVVIPVETISGPLVLLGQHREVVELGGLRLEARELPREIFLAGAQLGRPLLQLLGIGQRIYLEIRDDDAARSIRDLRHELGLGTDQRLHPRRWRTSAELG